MAQGFRQIYGVQFLSTMAPVGKLTTFRAMLAELARRGMDLQFLDIKSAYLTADMDMDCYMEPPPGVVPPQPGYVMKLEKGLYGLRQGARLFHQKFRKDLLAWGFRASTADPCLFIKHRNGSVFRILLFVDDMALMSDSTDDGRSMRDDLLKRVANKYKFSTQPDDNVYLGMAVDRIDETTVFLNQTRYIGDVLRKYGFDGGRSTYTPSAGQPVRVDDCWMDAAESEWVDKYKDKFVECGGKMVPVEAPPRPKASTGLCVKEPLR